MTVTVDPAGIPAPTTMSPILIPCVPPSTKISSSPEVPEPVLSLMTFVPSIGAFTALVDGTELRVVSLKISLKPLIIPSVKVNNLIEASSR